MHFRKALMVFAASIALAACGGGDSSSTAGGGTGGSGGGSGGNSNTAPVVSINVSDMTPNEGLSSTLDASGSSDADGNSLTFSWSQTAGPTVIIEDTAAAVITVKMPEVDMDEALTFQLTVSDGTESVGETSELTITNIAQIPESGTDYFHNEDFSTSLNVAVMDGSLSDNYDTIVLSGTDVDGYEIRKISIDDQNTVSSGDTVLATFDHKVTIRRRGQSIVLLDETESTVSTMDSNGVVTSTVTIDSPCDVTFRDNHMIVGKRTGGGSVYRITGPENNIEHEVDFEGGSSLCSLEAIRNNVDETIFFGAIGESSPDISKLLAFDETAEQFLLFDIVLDSTGTLTSVDLLAEQPINTNLAEGEAADFVFARESVRGLGVVYSDGETDGIHRFVAAGVSNDAEILQETHQWPYGTPTDMHVSFPAQFLASEIVIIAKDSPQAIILRGGDSLNDYGEDPGPFLPLRGPEYLEIGLGAERLESARSIDNNLSGIVIAYPEKQILKFLAADSLEGEPF